MRFVLVFAGALRFTVPMPETSSAATADAAIVGDFIVSSPEHADPRDAEVYLQDLVECNASAMGGWKDPAFIEWRAAFEEACKADADVRKALLGIWSSVYFADGLSKSESRTLLRRIAVQPTDEEVAEMIGPKPSGRCPSCGLAGPDRVGPGQIVDNGCRTCKSYGGSRALATYNANYSEAAAAIMKVRAPGIISEVNELMPFLSKLGQGEGRRMIERARQYE